VGGGIALKLILVRHGETQSNKENRVQGTTDSELNDNGRIQAEKLAESLKNEPIAGIVSSPLKRAYQTAKTIGKYHKAAIALENKLQEINHGDFEDITIEELKANHLPFLEQWVLDPSSVAMPNGESLQDLQIRAWSAIKKVIENSKNHLVVSHNMTIMTILCKIQNLNLARAREFRVDVASKTVVEFDNGQGIISIFNDTSHLKGI
jgi:broad specificity phosphatase PhoE